MNDMPDHIHIYNGKSEAWVYDKMNPFMKPMVYHKVER